MAELFGYALATRVSALDDLRQQYRQRDHAVRAWKGAGFAAPFSARNRGVGVVDAMLTMLRRAALTSSTT